MLEVESVLGVDDGSNDDDISDGEGLSSPGEGGGLGESPGEFGDMSILISESRSRHLLSRAACP